jgi:hypothetical protein
MTGFVLAALCFVMPFATVSCVPGGFGRAQPDAATTYLGIDLVAGDEPQVNPPEKARPPSQQTDDRLPAQALEIAALGLAVAGALAAGLLTRPLVRRMGALAVAVVAAALLVAGEAVVRDTLADRVREQLTQPLPAGREPIDYVGTGPGFVLCLALLVVTAVGNGVAMLVARRRSRAPAVPAVPRSAQLH